MLNFVAFTINFKYSNKLVLKMDNYISAKYSKDLEELSKELGWDRTLFLGKDFIFLRSDKKKELLKEINSSKKKKLIVVYQPPTEELLRFALEKSAVDMVIGMEKLNLKDSVHFVRGGLDQITCKIAKSKGKQIGFSFNDILCSQNRGKLLGRMMFNIKLCKKYKVDVVFSNFGTGKEGLRSVTDLKSLFYVLGGVWKNK